MVEKFSGSYGCIWGVRRKCGKYCAVKLRNVLMFSFIGVSFVRHLSFVEVN